MPADTETNISLDNLRRFKSNLDTVLATKQDALDIASYDTAGIVKLGSSSASSQTIESASSASGRQYPIVKDANGRVSINVPWTDTTGEALSTTEVDDILDTGFYPDPVLANNSWAIIKAVSKSGNIPSTWLGQTKSLTYNGQTYQARLVDTTGKFQRAADKSTAYLYFELTNLLPDSEQFNSSNSNVVANSPLLASMNSGTIWSKFDSDLKAVLENVDVKVMDKGDTGRTLTTLPFKLFLAREADLFSSRQDSVPTEFEAITQDEYYQTHDTAADRKKSKLATSTSYIYYWEISPAVDYSDLVCGVISFGSSGLAYASDAYGVAVRFVL